MIAYFDADMWDVFRAVELVRTDEIPLQFTADGYASTLLETERRTLIA